MSLRRVNVQKWTPITSQPRRNIVRESAEVLFNCFLAVSAEISGPAYSKVLSDPQSWDSLRSAVARESVTDYLSTVIQHLQLV